MLKELDLRADAPWKLRFRAPAIVWTSVASQNPKRGLVCTNKDGIYQLYSWNVETGELRQATQQGAGLLQGSISADGEWIYYLKDDQGNELGHYVRVPFNGGEAEDISPDMPKYASFYLSESPSGNLVGFTAAAMEWGFRIYVVDKAGKICFTYENASLSVGPNLSYDGTIAVIATTEKSGTTDTMLEAYDIASGQKLGELDDGKTVSISPIGFIPRANDERYLAISTTSGFARPLIWHPRTGERRDIALPELEGEVYPWDWSEDGRYLLLNQLSQAEFKLYLYDLVDNQLITLQHPSGAFAAGYFVGDEIFVSMQNSVQPLCLVALDKLTGVQKRVVLQAGTPPTGQSWRSVHFNSSDGMRIQAWLMTPAGEGPFPTVVHTHGGPTSVQTESYSPAAQAWVEHGFAYFSINYRGSVTFGKAFEKSILGNLGELEVEDIEAGVKWLIDNKIAQPDMILKTGGSYGGYLTLQSLGKKPQLWAGGMAVVAIADWAVMYEDEAETLRGYQRALFGGSPEEKPEAMKKSSPITYAEKVKAPILVIQGENDTRCPARQMHLYEDKMKSLGKHIEINWFDAGHGSRAMEQQIEQEELKMRFAYRVLG
jgi:dipeptidyl aminopeptidase/acylaminoacyl peptidase